MATSPSSDAYDALWPSSPPPLSIVEYQFVPPFADEPVGRFQPLEHLDNCGESEEEEEPAEDRHRRRYMLMLSCPM